MKWLPPPPCRVPAVAIEAARIMAIKQKRKDFVFIAMQRVLNIIHLKPGKVVKFEGARSQSSLLALFSGLRSTGGGAFCLPLRGQAVAGDRFHLFAKTI